MAISAVMRSDCIQQSVFFDTMAEDCLFKIFSFFSPMELWRTARVCGRFNSIISQPRVWNCLDLKNISPLIKVIDEMVWRKYLNQEDFGLDFQGVCPLDQYRLIPRLYQLLAPGVIENNAGVTVCLFPKNLTLLKLKQLSTENEIVFVAKAEGRPFLIKKYGDIALEKPEWKVLTNGVLGSSRNKESKEQREILIKCGLEPPGYLEVLTLAIFSQLVFEKRPQGEEYLIGTRCAEQLESGDHLFVGNFMKASRWVVFSHIRDGNDENVGAIGQLQNVDVSILRFGTDPAQRLS